jgi:nucleotide-binding universal stress UspA family protein
MYRKILIAYNGTQGSRYALDECIRLAPGPTAEIHLLAVVIPPAPVLIGEYAAAVVINVEEEMVAAKHEMERQLSIGHAHLADAGLNVIKHLEVGDPVNAISEVAEKLGIELVIIGHSRQQSWAARWWRSSTDTLLIEKVRCSLLLATNKQGA